MNFLALNLHKPQNKKNKMNGNFPKNAEVVRIVLRRYKNNRGLFCLVLDSAPGASDVCQGSKDNTGTVSSVSGVSGVRRMS